MAIYIKLPFVAIIDKAMKLLREQSHASDAVIILIDDKTNEMKVKTMRGDIRRLHHLLDITLKAIEKQHLPQGKESSIIMPN